MAKQLSLQINGVGTLAVPKPTKNEIETSDYIASSSRHHPSSEPELSILGPACVQLNLEDLKCFEAVERQFQRWGIVFHNCIAIHPSNPAFPPRSGTTVLMGAPKSGWLEIAFLHPVCSVSAFVTSSQRLVLSAYDRDNLRLDQVELPEPNLAGSDCQIPPNTQLTLKAANIHRITFCAFDGQFTVDDLRFEL